MRNGCLPSGPGVLLMLCMALACAPRAVQASPPSSTVSATAAARTVEGATPQGRAGAGAAFAFSNSFTARRRGRFVVVELLRPHRVLSTSTRFGGESTKITHLVNFQSMEARGNGPQFERRLELGSAEYHRVIIESLGLSPAATALMGTAADMNHMVHVSRAFRGLRVDALVTGGVRGNAVRAGDPAHWYQADEGNRHVPEKGTINVMLLINRPLLPGAMVKAASVLTEAKSAALGELAVGSRASRHLATGTGTDQFVVAAPLAFEPKQGEPTQPLESASQHLVLGELIGDTVRRAVLEAVRRQNALEPSATRNVVHALARFGLNEERVSQGLAEALPQEQAEFARANRQALLSSPRVVAAAYGYAALLDRIAYGTLPPELRAEVLRDQAATIAVAVAARPCDWPEFWDRLPDATENDPLRPLLHGLALGFAAKWAFDTGAAVPCGAALSVQR